MSKFLDARGQIIARNSWVLSREEKEKLDHFFLVRNKTLYDIEGLFTYDAEEYKRYMLWEGKEYEVILMRPLRVLRTAREIGLSFRVHRALNLRVVLINEWQERQEEVTNG